MAAAAAAAGAAAAAAATAADSADRKRRQQLQQLQLRRRHACAPKYPAPWRGTSWRMLWKSAPVPGDGP
eukprot:365126-Chlamydomonas_euryale.AAC.9